MSINPDNITTIRVDQLAAATLNLTNEFPHSEDATLRKATIQSLVDLVATSDYGEGSYAFLIDDNGNILTHLGYDERQAQLAQVAGYLHDIGNMINRHL